jgi:hypothetical protein
MWFQLQSYAQKGEYTAIRYGHEKIYNSVTELLKLSTTSLLRDKSNAKYIPYFTFRTTVIAAAVGHQSPHAQLQKIPGTRKKLSRGWTPQME